MNDSTTRDQSPLRRVGAMWRPRDGSRSLGSGTVTIGTQRQKFVILENRYKQREQDPDYVLMSSEPPQPDPYAQREPRGRDTDDDQYDGDADRRARESQPARSQPRRTPW